MLNYTVNHSVSLGTPSRTIREYSRTHNRRDDAICADEQERGRKKGNMSDDNNKFAFYYIAPRPSSAEEHS